MSSALELRSAGEHNISELYTNTWDFCLWKPCSWKVQDRRGVEKAFIGQSVVAASLYVSYLQKSHFSFINPEGFQTVAQHAANRSCLDFVTAPRQ